MFSHLSPLLLSSPLPSPSPLLSSLPLFLLLFSFVPLPLSAVDDCSHDGSCAVYSVRPFIHAPIRPFIHVAIQPSCHASMRRCVHTSIGAAPIGVGASPPYDDLCRSCDTTGDGNNFAPNLIVTLFFCDVPPPPIYKVDSAGGSVRNPRRHLQHCIWGKGARREGDFIVEHIVNRCEIVSVTRLKHIAFVIPGRFGFGQCVSRIVYFLDPAFTWSSFPRIMECGCWGGGCRIGDGSGSDFSAMTGGPADRLRGGTRRRS